MVSCSILDSGFRMFLCFNEYSVLTAHRVLKNVFEESFKAKRISWLCLYSPSFQPGYTLIANFHLNDSYDYKDGYPDLRPCKEHTLHPPPQPPIIARSGEFWMLCIRVHIFVSIHARRNELKKNVKHS